eukprot:1152052-Pelagomonas_calceolata.AAC.4
MPKEFTGVGTKVTGGSEGRAAQTHAHTRMHTHAHARTHTHAHARTHTHLLLLCEVSNTLALLTQLQQIGHRVASSHDLANRRNYPCWAEGQNQGAAQGSSLVGAKETDPWKSRGYAKCKAGCMQGTLIEVQKLPEMHA